MLRELYPPKLPIPEGLPSPDTFGLKLKPTSSPEVLVNVSESTSQNLLWPKNFVLTNFYFKSENYFLICFRALRIFYLKKIGWNRKETKNNFLTTIILKKHENWILNNSKNTYQRKIKYRESNVKLLLSHPKKILKLNPCHMVPWLQASWKLQKWFRNPYRYGLEILIEMV